MNARGASPAPVAERVMLSSLVLVVALLSLWPMLRLLLEGIAPAGSVDLSLLRDVLSQDVTWRATARSLVTSLGATVVSVLLGGAFALLVALTDIRAKTALVFCFMIPLMIPPQITALSWIQMFGPSSALLDVLGLAPAPGTPNPMYSREGIIALLGIQHAPLVFLALRAGLRALPRELVEAARASGASHLRVVRDIVLPLMTPSLVAGSALAFVSAMGNFGIPAMLGIPVSYSTLPVLIYQRLSGFGPGIISEVAVLSILVGIIAFTGVLLQSYMLRRRDYRTIVGAGHTLALNLGRWRGAAEASCWLIIVMILVVPLLALTATSLVSAYGVSLSLSSATLDAYSEVLFSQSVTARAFLNSGLLAFAAAATLLVLCVPLGYFITWHSTRALRLLNLAAELPYALPGVVLAIACILIFLKPLPLLGISLYGTLGIIFVAYLARFLTLALRPVLSGFAQVDRTLEEAAQGAGAHFMLRLRTIIAPLVLPSAAAGAILVFMTAFNELTVSALLWSSGTETLGVVVFSLDDGGDTVLASAMAVLAVLVIVAIMSSLQLLAKHLPHGVLPWQV